ncbi:MAG: S9 family peptidase [Candidatus Marinimicrobia bacterium]|nr:S9 family peptidase [Candidatus Neomarinimicrobiota bacterium]MBT3633150.1 S9 family peptidase [Candidatus Neomarinimicrobiota bacterium]MBT3682249.1 S9 family peptidase [Candidatus Neomarinimicrobiota bacterium]MBT3758750.1 S9 family peptidase [Candidatus Neomarinimicrobiota bacterium]MBT3895376.1 S9 family peptidase [Candidatus Neomarinimicrobiota bacterium]
MITIEDLFRKPEKINIELSPDGKTLAYLAPHKRRMNLFVKALPDGEVNQLTHGIDRDIQGYTWCNNDRLIYLKDTGGDENTRLYSVGIDGTNNLDLTPFKDVKCDIVDELENDDDHVLIQMNKRKKEFFDVYRLNVQNGQLDLIAENPGNISQWFTDHDGKLRLCVTTDGVNNSILFRETEAFTWKTVATYNFVENAIPLFFTFDNQSIYVSSNVNSDKSSLFTYDLRTGKETLLIYEHDEVDISRLMISKKRKLITGVSYYTDRLHYHFFDDEREKLQNFLDDKLPGYENSVTSFDREENSCTVHSGSDRTLGAYYYCDLKSWTLTKLFDLTPWLSENDMAEMKPIKYTSRDGLVIHGYLSVPNDKKAEKLPVVVHPHGGPWHRDAWGYNPAIQFLVNRGFAVFQMNFRGSTGYGKSFLKASFKQWGQTMQDDITDGVQYLIDRGIADPDKLAIFGGSYGGYATLSAIVKTPDVYACAIDFVGVSNLFTFLETIPPYWKQYLEMMYEMVGHPEKDREMFEKYSPAKHADKIKTPLFIAQGANDPRVKKNESDQMVNALKERGIEIEYMVKDNEGHGFQNEENIFDFYRAMESFLHKHIST